MTAILWAIASGYLCATEYASPQVDWVILVGTPFICLAVISAGVISSRAIKDGEWLAGGIIALSTVIGSLYMITGTIDRQGVARDIRANQAEQIARQRETLMGQLADINGQLVFYRRELVSACAKGEAKPGCLGGKAMVVYAEQEVRKIEQSISELRSAGPGALEGRVALAISMISGKPKADILPVVEQFLSALLSGFLDLAAFGFAKYGWSQPSSGLFSRLSGLISRRRDSEQTSYPAGNSASLIEAKSRLVDDSHADDCHVAGRTDGRREEVLAEIQAMMAAGEQFPLQKALCEKFAIPRSTMSAWMAYWEERGDIPPRQQHGRTMRIVSG